MMISPSPTYDEYYFIMDSMTTASLTVEGGESFVADSTKIEQLVRQFLSNLGATSVSVVTLKVTRST